MNLRILTTCLLLSSASVWGAGDVSSAEKNGLKIEIKFVDEGVELTKPLAVEVTLTNTSDKDMRLLGIRNLRLKLYSADGKIYVEAPDAIQVTTTGYFMPKIKAGESRVVIEDIELDRLRQRNISVKDYLSRGREAVQLEPGDYKVGMKPNFNSAPRGPNEPQDKDLYVGSPGLVQISFTLKKAE